MGREKIILDKDALSKIGPLAGLGLNVGQIAACLGISKKTLERRVAEDSDAKDAKDAKDALDGGRSKADAEVVAMAFQMAKSGNHPTMTQFWLRARCGWKEHNKEQVPLEIKLIYSL